MSHYNQITCKKFNMRDENSVRQDVKKYTEHLLTTVITSIEIAEEQEYPDYERYMKLQLLKLQYGECLKLFYDNNLSLISIWVTLEKYSGEGFSNIFHVLDSFYYLSNNYTVDKRKIINRFSRQIASNFNLWKAYLGPIMSENEFDSMSIAERIKVLQQKI